MGIKIVHFKQGQEAYWGVTDGEVIRPLPTRYPTLRDFLLEGQEEARQLSEDAESLAMDEVTLLSPVTKPAKIVCQAVNYASHRKESAFDVNKPAYNMIFNKANSALTGPYSDIIRPKREKALDYEVELGLIMGRDVFEAQEVTDDNLGDYVAGFIIANDISARSVQKLEGEFFKGKSYRTFLPTGPWLYLLDEGEIDQVHNLDIKLWVNDELRQSSNTELLLFKPAETLTELSEIIDLETGDLILTGTSSGVAMNMSHDLSMYLSDGHVSFEEKLKAFEEEQLAPGNKYLQPGDLIRAEIQSADGSIDLGRQVNKVVEE